MLVHFSRCAGSAIQRLTLVTTVRSGTNYACMQQSSKFVPFRILVATGFSRRLIGARAFLLWLSNEAKIKKQNTNLNGGVFSLLETCLDFCDSSACVLTTIRISTWCDKAARVPRCVRYGWLVFLLEGCVSCCCVGGPLRVVPDLCGDLESEQSQKWPTHGNPTRWS